MHVRLSKYIRSLSFVVHLRRNIGANQSCLMQLVLYLSILMIVVLLRHSNNTCLLLLWLFWIPSLQLNQMHVVLQLLHFLARYVLNSSSLGLVMGQDGSDSSEGRNKTGQAGLICKHFCQFIIKVVKYRCLNCD